jgi:hypothetical protein
MTDASINAGTLSIRELFTARRFGVTFYQREYTWSRADVKALLTDLHGQFSREWQEIESPDTAQRSFPPYYLGALVYYDEHGTTYLIDGQQRITTLNLLLLHVRLLLLDQDLVADDVDDLVLPGPARPTFALDVAEHRYLYEAMRDGVTPVPRPFAADSDRRLLERGADLEEDFPAELHGEALGPFVDWLLDRVCVVGIEAVDSDHGWHIFETTNDRGVRLGPIDLLKGYLLVAAQTGQQKLNEAWRDTTSHLAGVGPRTPSDFVKAYLLAKFARLDDEADQRQIAEAFHEWVRCNPERIGLTEPADYVRLVRDELARAGHRFVTPARAAVSWDPQWAAVFYNEHNRIPHHFAAMLAATSSMDTDVEFAQKTRLVATYLDLLYVRRLVPAKIKDAAELGPDVLDLIGRLRTTTDVSSVRTLLSDEVRRLGGDLRALDTLGLTRTNGGQVRYLLARMTSYAETAIGRPDQFAEYVAGSPPYPIAHVWGERYDKQLDVAPANFPILRNRIGGLLLLPPSARLDVNLGYAGKLAFYKGQHILAASLHPDTHQGRGSAIRAWIRDAGLQQVLHPVPGTFTGDALVDRQLLARRLCELIWDPAALGLAGPAAASSSSASSASSSSAADQPALPARAVHGPRPDLEVMLEKGHLQLGEELVGVRNNVRTGHIATLLQGGQIQLSTGGIYNTPDQAGAAALNQKTCSGWTFWHVIRDNTPIAIGVRRDAAEQTGDLPPRPARRKPTRRTKPASPSR